MLVNHRSLLSCDTYCSYSSPSVDSILLTQFLVIDSKKLSFSCIKLQLGFMYLFQLTNDLRFWCIYYTFWPDFITGSCIRLIHDRSCHYQNKNFYSNHGHGFSNQKNLSYCCCVRVEIYLFFDKLNSNFIGNWNIYIATMTVVMAT